jgi:TolB-like protein/DNA-binding winged helix-turn-helix (wHTH) protein/cytochrome c-type biogenesis protein CcmH/NrfG
LAVSKNKAERFTIGDLFLDSGTVTVMRQGTEVSLPGLSFDLLLCLARHAPNVVTTETLMDEVWGQVVVSDETVKQRVKLLRQALGDSGSKPQYIAAVRGKGYRLIAAVSDERPKAGPTRRRFLPWLIAGSLLSLAVLVSIPAWRTDDSKPSTTAGTPTTADVRRVAVLPFDNFSGRAEDEYLADGITEDIISALAQIPDLGVIARTTVMSYKNSNRRVREIARELHVGTLLEGSIQRFDQQLKITVQMIDAATEEHYWAKTFEIGLADLPLVQTEIAEQVATRLKVTISEEGRKALSRGSTSKPEAYDAYLKGRAAYRRWTLRDNETALAFYQQAVELDPDFALAIAGVANALALRATEFGGGSESIELAISHARRALDLDPGLPEAHKALGICYFYQGLYQQAADQNRSALNLAPHYDEANFNLAEIYQLQGRWDEAVRYQLRDSDRPGGRERLSIYLRNLGFNKQADALSDELRTELPVSLFGDESLSLYYLLNGEYELALQITHRIQKSFPNAALGWVREGEIQLARNELAAAEKSFESALAMSGNSHSYARIRLAQLLLLRDESMSADLMLQESEEVSLKAINLGHEGWFHRWNLAFIHSLKGNREAALSWYERAVDSGRRRFEWDERESAFQLLAGEPRFQAALQRQKEARSKMKQNVTEILDTE